jgi:hypothetical protein
MVISRRLSSCLTHNDKDLVELNIIELSLVFPARDDAEAACGRSGCSSPGFIYANRAAVRAFAR